MQEIHDIYMQCKDVFKPSTELMDLISEFEDEKEREFYKILCDFFLQKKQEEVIRAGLF